MSNKKGSKKQNIDEKKKKKKEQNTDNRKYIFSKEDACILAKSGKYRLVQDRDHLLVLEERYCEDVKQRTGELLDFNPASHKTALKLTGYDFLSDMCKHPYGPGKKNTLFTYTRAGREQWITKTGFKSQLGQLCTDKFISNSKLVKAGIVSEMGDGSGNESGGGTVRRTIQAKFVSRTSDSSDPDSASEGSDESSSDDQPTTMHRIPRKSASSSRSRYVVDSKASGADSTSEVFEGSSDTDSASEVTEAASSDDQTVSRRTARKTKSSSPSTTPRSFQKNIFARTLFSQIHNIYINEDRIYDLEQLDREPDYIHIEPAPTFAPAVDKKFLLGLLLQKKLEKENYTLVGCVGLKHGANLWKAAILKLDKDLTKKLQNARRNNGVKYAGPALVPMSFFRHEIKGDTRKAEEFFDKTTLGKERGDMRYKSLEPEETQPNSRLLGTKLDHNYEMGQMNKAAKGEWEKELVKRAEKLTLEDRKKWGKNLERKAALVRSTC
jgi:hypothetical protein